MKQRILGNAKCLPVRAYLALTRVMVERNLKQRALARLKRWAGYVYLIILWALVANGLSVDCGAFLSELREGSAPDKSN